MCIIDVRVQPRARRQAHAWERDTLKVWLTAAPTDGQANEALIAYLADRLGIGKSKVRLIRGDKHRNKQIGVEGFDQAEVRARLG